MRVRKTDTQGHIFYDSLCMKYKSIRMESRAIIMRNRERVRQKCLMGAGCLESRGAGGKYHTVEIIKTTELCKVDKV